MGDNGDESSEYLPAGIEGILRVTESPRWFKSSYSNNGGTCIEVAANLVASHGVVPVRDSKQPDGPRIAVPADSFTSFVTAVKKGEFGA